MRLKPLGHLSSRPAIVQEGGKSTEILHVNPNPHDGIALKSIYRGNWAEFGDLSAEILTHLAPEVLGG